MTQIVDLAADVRWSEQDIVNKMEALIRAQCSATEELILHRKMLGAFAGIAGLLPSGAAYSLTADELAELQAYSVICYLAQAAGRQARIDAALLARVLDAEAGITPLDPADADGAALLATRAAARAPVEAPVDTPTEVQP